MSTFDGFLVIDKPEGWTSHDVVARMRRLTGVRRIGHAGTLDPMATGILPLGIGQATRLLEYLSDGDKRYQAVIRFGQTTSTDDATGEVTATEDPSNLDVDQVRVALSRFVGEIEQVPPAFSAVKQAGTPLYRLARAGIAVQARPRQVTIHAIELVSAALPEVTVTVACSKGTYIRGLARDVGTMLGCGAHLQALRRLQSGSFGEADARTLPEIEEAAASGALAGLVLPADVALASRPALMLSPEQERLVATGRPLESTLPLLPEGSLLRAYGDDGRFLAVLRMEDGWVRPYKVFPARQDQRGRENGGARSAT